MVQPVKVGFKTLDDLDRKRVSAWWNAAGVMDFRFDDLREDTTILATINDKPALCVSLILTDSSLALVDAFVGNPEIPKEERRQATPELLAVVQGLAKSHGKKRLLAMGPNAKLTEYYESLGFKKTMTVDTLIKEIH